MLLFLLLEVLPSYLQVLCERGSVNSTITLQLEFFPLYILKYFSYVEVSIQLQGLWQEGFQIHNHD